METEGIVEQFRLIEPRGMRWCQPRSPPRLPLKVVFGGRCGMTGITVMNQKHTAQVPMALPKLLQRLDVNGQRLYALGKSPPYDRYARSETPAH
jgi:hypothetical protein